MRNPLTLLLVLTALSGASADVRLPRIFTDHMILQQQTSNAIWGWAEPGERVSVKASWGAKASAVADEDGDWKLFLKTPAHGTGHSLKVAGRNTIAIKNVAIGEVWLCAGQSNMGWATGNSFEAENEADVDLPEFRIFKSAREHWHEPLAENRDRLCRWKPCDPEAAAETSAVSYYFGKKLHQELGIPVGIIQRAFAGTPIEGWMPWEIQSDDPRTRAHRAALDKNAERQIHKQGETMEKAIAAFARELAEYNAKIDAGETMKNQWKPLAPPIITKPANLGHQYPAHMFNAMIHPIRPYGFRGVIWYQGERNSKDVPQAFHYRKQLAQLIRFYRATWHEHSAGNVAKDFPFQFTQLPSWNPPQTQPVEGLEASWAVNREAMRLVTHDVPNTGMAVAIDTGDAVALHPKNKKPIGIRHALLALEQTYGRDLVGSGPRFRKQHIKSNRIVLEFDSIGSGLMTAKPGKLNAFAIAGADRQWHWAEAEIVGDTVVVSSPKVPKPAAVRYAWATNPSQRNLLYNREGLPASPFRTDDWPLFDPNDEILTVNKPKKPKGYESRDWKRPPMKAASAPPPIESNGLAPEITDLNAEDVSWAAEKNIPDLKQPYLSTAPQDRNDGIPVGKLGSDRQLVLDYAKEIRAGQHGQIDSLLIAHQGRLLFESYYRRGRINYPHFQMSITKSYTAMAIGRAIQLGHLMMADLNRPVVEFLKQLKRDQLVPGATSITLAEAMNMHSGIRIDKDRAKQLMRTPDRLKGQAQIQAYLEHSAPIPTKDREYKYQGSDPSIAMQVIETVVPGSARDFIEKELLAKMGITNFAWQDDVSGLAKSAAGSSMRSRDMLKWGMLVMNAGRWNGEQLIPQSFVQKATSRLYTNKQETSYGYFWWRHDMEVGDRKIDCISGRGAGGQFILMFPELELIVVVTAHHKGMGSTLKTIPERLLPAFLR